MAQAYRNGAAVPQAVRTDPNAKDPASALLDFLGANDPFANMDQSPYRDPSLELASLRGSRENELKLRMAAGDTSNNTAGRLGDVQKDLASDPFTGLLEQARATKQGDLMNQSSALQNPSNPIAQEQKSRDTFALQKTAAEHPNTNVSPFAAGGGGAGVGMDSGHGIPPPPGIDPALWQAKTADLTPEAAAKVSAVLRYDAKIPGGNVLARPEWSTITGRVMQIDPTFSQGNFDARQGYLQKFEKSDIPGSLDTVMHHLGTFNSSAKNLENSGGQPWSKGYNAAGNWIKEHTIGFPEKTAFADASNAVAGELANVFKATGATDQEIEGWKHNLTASATPEEFQQNVQTLVQLIRGRMDAVTNRYQTVMGKKPASLLSEESQQIWNQFGGNTHGEQGQPAGNTAMPAGTEGVVNGVPAIWDGHGWVAK